MKNILTAITVALFGLLIGNSSNADYVIKDGAAATQTIKAFNCSANICPGYVPMDIAGAAFGVIGNPFFTAPAVAANWGILTQGSTTSGQSGNMIMGAVTTASPTYTTAQTSPFSLDTSGNLRVNVVAGGAGGGAVSPSVATAWGILPQGSTTSGQSGNMIMGAVTTSAPAYTTAQTSPISLDTAGNLRVNVVAGGAGGGAVSPSVATAWGILPQGSTTSGQVGNMIMGAVSTSSPSYTTAQTSPISLDTSGNLRVNVVAGGAGGGAVTVADGVDVTQGAKADAPCTLPATTTACSEVAIHKAIANATNSPIPAGTATIGTAGQLPYPVGAVPITASATGTTAATTATLAGAAGKTTYICGYSIRANATAATTVTDTITGVITATMSSVLWVAPAASGLGVDEQIFSPCIPASSTNTSIAIVSGAPGSGGVVSSKGWGYQL